jgi:hypothetical protein
MTVHKIIADEKTGTYYLFDEEILYGCPMLEDGGLMESLLDNEWCQIDDPDSQENADYLKALILEHYGVKYEFFGWDY